MNGVTISWKGFTNQLPGVPLKLNKFFRVNLESDGTEISRINCVYKMLPNTVDTTVWLNPDPYVTPYYSAIYGGYGPNWENQDTCVSENGKPNQCLFKVVQSAPYA